MLNVEKPRSFAGKKQVVSVVTVMAMTFGTFLFVGCGGETAPKAEEKTEEVEAHSEEAHDHDHGGEEAHAATFACPMDCEEGKTYTEAGACPVCKMDLVEVETEAHSEEAHDHGAEEAHAHYKCPMDCEKGKLYEEAGTCPVCKMDLKEVEA